MQVKETYSAIRLQLETIYQDDFIEVNTDEHARFIFVKWLKHPQSEDFRKSFQKAADLTIANKYEYWLSDSRAIHYLEFADQNWLLEHMAPWLPEIALKKFARISTLESLALLDVTRIYQIIEKQPLSQVKTELEVFTSEQAALEWLFPGA